MLFALISLLFCTQPVAASAANASETEFTLDKVWLWTVYGRARSADGQTVTVNPVNEHAFWSIFDPKARRAHGSGWYNITPVLEVDKEGYGRINPHMTEAGTYVVEEFVSFTPWGPCNGDRPACLTAAQRGATMTALQYGGRLEVRVRLNGVLKNGTHVTRKATMVVGSLDGRPPRDGFAGIKLAIDGGPDFSFNDTAENGAPVPVKYGTYDGFRWAAGNEEPMGDGVGRFVRLNNTPLLSHLLGARYQAHDNPALRIRTIGQWYDVASALMMLTFKHGQVIAELPAHSRAFRELAYVENKRGADKPVRISGPAANRIDWSKMYTRTPGEVGASGPDNWWFGLYGRALTKLEGGKTIVFNQHGYHTAFGIFNAKTGEVNAGGWYYTLDEAGVLTEVGIWSALEVKSFDTFGQSGSPTLTGRDIPADPGYPANPLSAAEMPDAVAQFAKAKVASDQLRASLRPPATSVSGLRFKPEIDGMKETAINGGGLLVFTVEMRGVRTADGKPVAMTATVYDGCIDGDAPVWGYEGIKVTIDGGPDYPIAPQNPDGRGPLPEHYGPWPRQGFTGNRNVHNTPLYAHLRGKTFEPEGERYLNMRTIDDWRTAHTISSMAGVIAESHFALIAGDRRSYPPDLEERAIRTLGLGAAITDCPPPWGPLR